MTTSLGGLRDLDIAVWEFLGFLALCAAIHWTFSKDRAKWWARWWRLRRWLAWVAGVALVLGAVAHGLPAGPP